MVRLETELAEWSLDEACLVTGRKAEHALSKNEDPFSHWNNGHRSRGAYRSASPYVTRKVKIKNGVW